MTTSQKAKYIFGAILSAALFLFLFFYGIVFDHRLSRHGYHVDWCIL